MQLLGRIAGSQFTGPCSRLRAPKLRAAFDTLLSGFCPRCCSNSTLEIPEVVVHDLLI